MLLIILDNQYMSTNEAVIIRFQLNSFCSMPSWYSLLNSSLSVQSFKSLSVAI